MAEQREDYKAQETERGPGGAAEVGVQGGGLAPASSDALAGPGTVPAPLSLQLVCGEGSSSPGDGRPGPQQGWHPSREEAWARRVKARAAAAGRALRVCSVLCQTSWPVRDAAGGGAGPTGLAFPRRGPLEPPLEQRAC